MLPLSLYLCHHFSVVVATSGVDVVEDVEVVGVSKEGHDLIQITPA